MGIFASDGAVEGPVQQHAILIVDDDARNLAILADYLQDIEITVLVAEDGESGLERARYARPDLILLDVLLPGMDGYATCLKLKADPATADIPVIFMTALAETEFKLRGFEAGGVDYVTKPFQREEVLARVGVHIRIARLTQNLRDANDFLERRVAERTRELAEANRELEADIERRRRDEENLRKLLEEKSVLLREIHHRVKNNLQLIASILNLQANSVSDPEINAMFWRCQERIMAIALVHEELYRSVDFASIDFHCYVDDLVAGLAQGGREESREIEISNEVSGVSLPIESAVPCALALGEFLSNALRHAFPGGWEGKRSIRISMTLDGGRCLLLVSDSGVGLPLGLEPGKAKSLGLQLASAAVAQLHGVMTVEPGQGTSIRLEFPGEGRAKEGEEAQAGE